MYNRSLPELSDILWLSKVLRDFPITRGEIVRIARRWNVSEDMIAFLRQLSSDDVFDGRIEFISRCEKQMDIIREQWESPKLTLQTKLL